MLIFEWKKTPYDEIERSQQSWRPSNYLRKLPALNKVVVKWFNLGSIIELSSGMMLFLV